MTMNLKLTGQIFLTYFGLFGLFVLATWVKYIFNMLSDGGEMSDSIFLLGLIIVTIYLSSLSFWTYNVLKNKESYGTSTIIQLAFIFLLGICPSLFGLIYTYS